MANEEMFVGSFLNFGIECAKRHWLTFFGLLILASVIAAASFGISAGLVWLPSELFSSENPYSNPIRGLGILCALASAVLLITLSFGFVKNVLNICRGQRVELKALVAFKPMVIIHYIIAMLITAVIVAAGFILLIIPGIFLLHRLHMVPLLVIDMELGAIEAIKESWYLTTGHFMDLLFGFFIGSFFCNLFSVFIITLIFTIPMQFFLLVYPYLRLTGQLDYAEEYLLAAETGSAGSGNTESGDAEPGDAEPKN
jgi:hypothetical protein